MGSNWGSLYGCQPHQWNIRGITSGWNAIVWPQGRTSEAFSKAPYPKIGAVLFFGRWPSGKGTRLLLPLCGGSNPSRAPTGETSGRNRSAHIFATKDVKSGNWKFVSASYSGADFIQIIEHCSAKRLKAIHIRPVEARLLGALWHEFAIGQRVTNRCHLAKLRSISAHIGKLRRGLIGK